MKIIVLAGGFSPERDVSLSSGSLIANALMDNGHEVCLVDSYLGMALPDELHYRRKGQGQPYSYEIGTAEPDLAGLKASSGMGEAVLGPGVLEACKDVDMVFIALHGGAGENGQIQAALDLMGIAYTGTGFAGCQLAMDKETAKIIARFAGIRTPAWVTVRAEETVKLPFFPCVVKPCGCGSSVGVTMVDREEDLSPALEAAAQYEGKILVEEKITGREFSVGVLGEEALPPIEIIPREGFYDYQNKYQPGLTEEICPAALSRRREKTMKDMALKVHKALQLGYYSRIDFFMDSDEELYFLEANTLPGMTPCSLLPQEAKAAGISFHQLCETIVRHGKGEGV